jgi:hypothetical protein
MKNDAYQTTNDSSQHTSSSSSSSSSSNPYHVPRGWDYWFGLVGNSVNYNYSIIQSDDNGQSSSRQSYGNRYEHDYLPDVVTTTKTTWIKTTTTTTTTIIINHNYR